LKNLWNSEEAADFLGDLGQRVYSSRLLGLDPSLVLHGGGNTSVKILEKNVFGEAETILHVKGSGEDLAAIEVTGFSPCRMGHLLRMAELSSLSDTRMASELRACMTNPSAPAPSVEALLHALLPAKFVDHTHADALIAVSNTPDGEGLIREVYGSRVAVIPYAMPGFKLARACSQQLAAKLSPDAIGVVLMNHGLISFGETAEESYGRMVELVTLAEEFLASRGAWSFVWPKVAVLAATMRHELASFRKDLSAQMGAPAILSTQQDEQSFGFIWRTDAAEISQQGPATPDHVIRTKRLPLLGRDLKAYRARYETYFNTGPGRSFPKPAMLDPAPRVVLDPLWGMIVIGRTARDAAIVNDLYRHTIDIIVRASAIGGWKALPAAEIAAVEYWDLEQAKLRKAGPPLPFAGEIVLITGAASGIGRACVDAFLKKGAAVIGLDVDPAVVALHDRPDYIGVVCDLAIDVEIAEALEEAVRTFGGLDMLVLNAGIFPKTERIGDLSRDSWRQVMTVNLDAAFIMMRECHPLLKLAPNGGRVVVIGSKNVPAPGPGAAAYSASKAAVNQLTRVAALEWGADRIRINSLHPNMVFDTALWTRELLESRARNYGMTVEAYKRNNVLGVEVLSRDVAELAAELCGPLFAKTTGAQLPVDGGNERVI
jgi:rhamnose utilization protein RhaD (predicted bifunctional aldolase and dehydrogenase)/NAD(P)-dependent dehydrogenase (short-subunit alcohol dehydrogenase family)